MVSSGNFAVLHEILTKIAEDSTAYAVAHVPASNPSFDADHTSPSISSETESSFGQSEQSFGQSEQSFGQSEQSFDPDRTISVIESRQSDISSKTQTYCQQSNEIDPERQSTRPQDSPRVVWSENEISKTIEYIGDALQYIEQWGVNHVKMLEASKASLGLSGTQAHENT
jgi:hypothetical protein